MKSTLRLLAVALVAGAILGCATSSDKAPPPPYMTQAILKSFADIFDGSWSGVKIFVEPGASIPSDLSKVGLNPAEVVDRNTLIKRYQYEESAPAMAVVDAYQDMDGLVHVRISYSPLRIPGTHPATKGGVFHHVFKHKGDELILLRSTKSME